MKARMNRLLLLFLALAACAMGLAVTREQATGRQAGPRPADAGVNPEGESPRPTGVEASNIRDRWGTEIVAIRLSAAGQMLDFRYRVIDPDKAAPILDPKVKPYLIDQKSGARLAVPITPMVGSLRQTVRSGKPMANRTYSVLFGNPGRFVVPGDEVTVVVGDFRAEGLMVQ